MKTKKERVRAEFVGISFAGFRWPGTTEVSIPVNVFRKILASGRVRCHRDLRLTDDFKHDSDTDFGKAELWPSVLIQDLKLGKPTLLYLDTKENVISFLPHRNLRYSIHPRQEEVASGEQTAN